MSIDQTNEITRRELLRIGSAAILSLTSFDSSSVLKVLTQRERHALNLLAEANPEFVAVVANAAAANTLSLNYDNSRRAFNVYRNIISGAIEWEKYIGDASTEEEKREREKFVLETITNEACANTEFDPQRLGSLCEYGRRLEALRMNALYGPGATVPEEYQFLLGALSDHLPDMASLSLGFLGDAIFEAPRLRESIWPSEPEYVRAEREILLRIAGRYFEDFIASGGGERERNLSGNLAGKALRDNKVAAHLGFDFGSESLEEHLKKLPEKSKTIINEILKAQETPDKALEAATKHMMDEVKKVREAFKALKDVQNNNEARQRKAREAAFALSESQSLFTLSANVLSILGLKNEGQAVSILGSSMTQAVNALTKFKEQPGSIGVISVAASLTNVVSAFMTVSSLLSGGKDPVMEELRALRKEFHEFASDVRASLNRIEFQCQAILKLLKDVYEKIEKSREILQSDISALKTTTELVLSKLDLQEREKLAFQVKGYHEKLKDLRKLKAASNESTSFLISSDQSAVELLREVYLHGTETSRQSSFTKTFIAQGESFSKRSDAEVVAALENVSAPDRAIGLSPHLETFAGKTTTALRPPNPIEWARFAILYVQTVQQLDVKPTSIDGLGLTIIENLKQLYRDGEEVSRVFRSMTDPDVVVRVARETVLSLELLLSQIKAQVSLKLEKDHRWRNMPMGLSMTQSVKLKEIVNPRDVILSSNRYSFIDGPSNKLYTPLNKNYDFVGTSEEIGLLKFELLSRGLEDVPNPGDPVHPKIYRVSGPIRVTYLKGPWLHHNAEFEPKGENSFHGYMIQKDNNFREGDLSTWHYFIGWTPMVSERGIPELQRYGVENPQFNDPTHDRGITLKSNANSLSGFFDYGLQIYHKYVISQLRGEINTIVQGVCAETKNSDVFSRFQLGSAYSGLIAGMLAWQLNRYDSSFRPRSYIFYPGVDLKGGINFSKIIDHQMHRHIPAGPGGYIALRDGSYVILNGPPLADSDGKVSNRFFSKDEAEALLRLPPDPREIHRRKQEYDPLIRAMKRLDGGDEHKKTKDLLDTILETLTNPVFPPTNGYEGLKFVDVIDDVMEGTLHWYHSLMKLAEQGKLHELPREIEVALSVIRSELIRRGVKL